MAILGFHTIPIIARRNLSKITADYQDEVTGWLAPPYLHGLFLAHLSNITTNKMLCLYHVGHVWAATNLTVM